MEFTSAELLIELATIIKHRLQEETWGILWSPSPVLPRLEFENRRNEILVLSILRPPDFRRLLGRRHPFRRSGRFACAFRAEVVLNPVAQGFADDVGAHGCFLVVCHVVFS